MSEYPDAFDEMLAAWNETESEKVRGHLEAALAPDIHFVDPANDISGIDAFEIMVHEVQKTIPGAVYSRISEVDSHHNLYRYHWAIHVDSNMLVQGFDVSECNEENKISSVFGFLGELPIRE